MKLKKKRDNGRSLYESKQNSKTQKEIRSMGIQKEVHRCNKILLTEEEETEAEETDVHWQKGIAIASRYGISFHLHLLFLLLPLLVSHLLYFFSILILLRLLRRYSASFFLGISSHSYAIAQSYEPNTVFFSYLHAFFFVIFWFDFHGKPFHSHANSIGFALFNSSEL